MSDFSLSIIQQDLKSKGLCPAEYYIHIFDLFKGVKTIGSCGLFRSLNKDIKEDMEEHKKIIKGSEEGMKVGTDKTTEEGSQLEPVNYKLQQTGWKGKSIYARADDDGFIDLRPEYQVYVRPDDIPDDIDLSDLDLDDS